MDIGIVLRADPPSKRVIELAKLAEQAGFTHVWVFDSGLLVEDAFVICSQILGSTGSIKVGTMVTNPATRDWTVIASMFASLNEMFGLRTICGIGRGDSALRMIGIAPVKLSILEEAIGVIRGLAAGREMTYKGQKVRIPWIEDGALEVWMAAYGPQALEVAGRQADGLIVQIGDPFVVGIGRAHV